MKVVRVIAAGLLLAILTVAIIAPDLATASYAKQFREVPDAPPTRAHLLGTDELGRDYYSRLLYGSRISLLLALAAAVLATTIAALVGGFAGFVGGWWERIAMAGTDLTLSLPWIFALITLRALLPLNISPAFSVVVTFALLSLLGWSTSARVVRAGTKALRSSDFVLHARALGCRPSRVLIHQLLPNLAPVLFAQFLISIPIFILSEANLGILGLGVSEPLPSWGSLLRGLENWSSVEENPWRLVPLILLIVVVSCFQIILPSERPSR